MKALIIFVLIFSSALFSAETATVYRGFNAGDFTNTRAMLATVKKDWNANMVRHWLKPIKTSRELKTSMKNAWGPMVSELPLLLDAAKKEGIVVAIVLEYPPEDVFFEKYGSNRNLLKTMMWKDPGFMPSVLACWEEIARICKDRPEEIWFDLLNEPADWEDISSFPKAWPGWAQKIIDAIRVIDRRHWVVIEPGPGGLPRGFQDFPPLKGEKIIYSCHIYEPHEYTHQGLKEIAATDLEKAFSDTGKNWPLTLNGVRWDVNEIEKRLSPALEFSKKNGVRMWIGEFSVIRWAPNGEQYLQDVIGLLEKYGWDWAYHSLGGGEKAAYWSLEHESTFSPNPNKSVEPTTRAKVVKEFMLKNKF